MPYTPHNSKSAPNSNIESSAPADTQNAAKNLTQDTTKSLAKLGFSHLLELAIHAPSGYTNNMPIRELKNGAQGALRIRVCHLAMFPKVCKIQAYALDLDEYIDLVFFHPKPYLKKSFALDSTLIVQGSIQQESAFSITRYTMIQPKITQIIGKILPKFKTTKCPSPLFASIASSLITRENLATFDLPSEVAESIIDIFNPNEAFLSAYIEYGGFGGRWLYALKFVEIFYHISMLAKKRHDFEAKFICNGDYQRFVDSLPFTLTGAQQRVCREIAHDLSQKKAAKRLIMGDVGCGKTMIILASVMMAYPQKSLLMAPTTVLARQLYEQAKLYLPKHINIALISSDSKQNLNGLFAQSVDFIIGTQALLYRDIQGERLALVMSDEQHRFGTKQRHQLEKLASDGANAKKPHILQFSATPIPRTMAMLESKLIDLSIIDELPYPKDITTKIISKSDFKDLLEHIKSEVALGHQVALIYPLVEESQNIEYLSIKEGEGFWKSRFERVYVTSGQDREKESVLEEFAQNGSILLATTLIEVGISLPKLSTIVIIAPERLGLATLHQLRGRVSRNGLKGYCYLYTNHAESSRLKEFATHLSGFDIAQIDLRYRKSGDLLSGKRQSGDQWIWADPSEDEAIFNRANEWHIANREQNIINITF